jgi:Kef-type K+ transport system membrane component KefB
MDFLPFFLIMLITVLFSTTFRRFHLPWVLALIASGIFIGPYGIDWIELNPTIEFMGQIGLIFLMFMAGLEVKTSSFKEFGRDISFLSIVNSLIPAAVGIVIGVAFGFDLIASFILGIIFMSSSIAVIIPSLEANGLMNTKLGRSIVSSTVVQDVASLVLLSIVLQTYRPVTDLPLYAFYPILAIVLAAFWFGLPKIRSLMPNKSDEVDLFESEVRIIFAMVIGTVITFELLGLHPIIAGFFTGLVLSQSISSEIILHKLHTISYGVFIPVFFTIVGMQTDMSVFFEGAEVLWLSIIILFGSMFAKYASGRLGARLIGFNKEDASLVGFASIPQLSTTLAVAFTGASLGLLPAELVTALVFLSVTTTIIAPLAISHLAAKRPRFSLRNIF